MTEANEVWKPVVGYEALYEVSNLGRVKRIAPGSGTYIGRILNPVKMTNGYFYVRLSRDVSHFTVHRIVARAFLGEPPTPKHDVNHKNGIRDDNRIENLEWVTRAENLRHAREVLGSHLGGRGKTRLAQRTISNETVAEIRQQLTVGESMASIARGHGISATTVYNIKRDCLRVDMPHYARRKKR